MLTETMWF